MSRLIGDIWWRWENLQLEKREGEGPFLAAAMFRSLSQAAGVIYESAGVPAGIHSGGSSYGGIEGGDGSSVCRPCGGTRTTPTGVLQVQVMAEAAAAVVLHQVRVSTAEFQEVLVEEEQKRTQLQRQHLKVNADYLAVGFRSDPAKRGKNSTHH